MSDTPERLVFTLETEETDVKKQPHISIIAIGMLMALLMGLVFGAAMGRASVKPVAEKPVVSPRVQVEVLYNKRPEVSIVTVDGVQYLSVNYLIGGAGITPLVVPATAQED